MRGLGQIAELCAIAQPHIGVITSIGPVHLELVGTVENVARAKAELVAALPAGGTAIVPAGVPELEPFLARTTSTSCDSVRAATSSSSRSSRASAPSSRSAAATRSSFPYRSRRGCRRRISSPRSRRTARSGCRSSRAAEGSAAIAFSPWRCEESPLPGGGLLINDAYNANPASMRAALEHLVDRAQRRRTVAVLGEMAELGAEAPRFHEEIGRVARELGVDVVVGVGELGAALRAGRVGGRRRGGRRGRAQRRRARRRGAREGVARRRARGRRRVARGSGRMLTRVLIAALVALIVSILVGPKFIEFLRRNEFGQHIREEGPQHHISKQGTPTMGGLLILFAATIAFLPVSNYRLQSLHGAASSRSRAARSASSTTSSS